MGQLDYEAASSRQSQALISPTHLSASNGHWKNTTTNFPSGGLAQARAPVHLQVIPPGSLVFRLLPPRKID